MVARRRGSLWSWLTARPYTLLTVVVLIGLGVSFFRRQQSDWEQVYVAAGKRLLQGQDLYAERAYMHPPLAAWLAAPFSGLPHPLGRLAWYGVSAAAALVVLRGAWRLSGGGRLQGRGVPWREHLILALGLGCAFTYVLG